MSGKQLKLEYFDLHGRSLSLRFLLWYTNMPFKDERLSFEQFGANKQAGKYKFGSVPELTLLDGKVLYQSLAISRWICLNGKGKNGENLYPGSKNPDQSYDIDNILEDSQSMHATSFALYQNPAELNNFIEKSWNPMMKKTEEYLEKYRDSGNFLVGETLSVADIDIGSWLMRFVYNHLNPHQAAFLKTLDNYPKTKAWGEETVKSTFKTFFATQPGRPF